MSEQKNPMAISNSQCHAHDLKQAGTDSIASEKFTAAAHT